MAITIIFFYHKAKFDFSIGHAFTNHGSEVRSPFLTASRGEMALDGNITKQIQINSGYQIIFDNSSKLKILRFKKLQISIYQSILLLVCSIPMNILIIKYFN
jgi:hypothetical protein